MVGHHTSYPRGPLGVRRAVSRRCVRVLSVAAALAMTSAAEASQIWDGGGANDNLGTAGNWSDDSLPNFAAALQLAGTTRLTPVQETVNRTIGGFTFNAAAGTFTISGQTAVLTGAITNSSGVTQTLDINLNIGSSPRDFAATSGDLIINGALTGAGANAIARTPITGTHTGTVFFNGANTHTGGVQANSGGNVALGHDSAVGTGGVLLFNGGTVRAAGGDRTIGNGQSLLSNSTIGGALALTFTGKLTQTSTAADRTLTVNNSALTTFAAVDLASNATSRKIVLNGTGAIDMTGVIAHGSTATASGITYTGSNTLQLLNAANTYRGATTVGLGGTIAVTSLGAAGLASSIGASTNATANLVLDGGTLKYVGSAATSTDRTFRIGLTGGAIDASGGGAISWTPAVALEWIGSTTARTFAFTGSSTHDNTFAGNLTNAGAGANGPTTVAKTGGGTWILSGTHTYTGATNIADGTLLITGSTAAANTVNLQKGTLGGTGNGSTTGKIGGAVNVGNGVLTASARDATLRPGVAGIGTLLTGALTFAADGMLDVQLDGTTPSTSDVVSVTGTVALGSEVAGLTVSYAAGGLAEGQKYFILLNDGVDAITGAFANLLDANGTLSTDDPVVLSSGDVSLLISYTGNSTTGDLTGGNDIVLYTAVPEPGMLSVLGLGATGLLSRRRRR